METSRCIVNTAEHLINNTLLLFRVTALNQFLQTGYKMDRILLTESLDNALFALVAPMMASTVK